MTRKAINAGGAAAVGPYSHAIETAGLLYLSGQTPIWISAEFESDRQRHLTVGDRLG